MNYDYLMQELYKARDDFLYSINNNIKKDNIYFRSVSTYSVWILNNIFDNIHIHFVTMKQHIEDFYYPVHTSNKIASDNTGLYIQFCKCSNNFYQINDIEFNSILDKSELFNLHVSSKIPSNLDYDMYEFFWNLINCNITEASSTISFSGTIYINYDL